MRLPFLMLLLIVSMGFSVHAAAFQSCQFSSVNEKTKRDAVYAQFGKPDRIIGDPLSIDVYEVTDGGEIWVSWIEKGAKQRFLYIQHVGGDLDHPLACK